MKPVACVGARTIRAGGRACAWEAGINGHMIKRTTRQPHPADVDPPDPATLEGRACTTFKNAMVAAAMAFALGDKLDAIRNGLRTFDTTFFQVPGRYERVQRAPVQGVDGLRTQRARGRGDGLPSATADVPAAGSSCRAGPRPPRRGPSCDRGGFRGKSTITSAAATTRCADAMATKSPESSTRAYVTWRPRKARSRSSPTNSRRSTPPCAWANRATLVLVFADALVARGKQSPSSSPRAMAQTVARIQAATLAPALDESAFAAMEGVVRDERGLYFEREAGD